MKNAFIAVIALAAHAPLAAAQPAAASADPADPADPAAPAPASQYESAFKGYRGYRETPLAPWREVNDEAARAGGHLGIFRAGPAASGASRGGAQSPHPGTGQH